MSGHSPKPGSLEISSVSRHGAMTVTLQGELDLSSAPRLEDHLVLVESEQPAQVVVDLAGLSFMDSSGLRVLLLADARAREHGHELLLRPGPESVQRVFEMTGALELLHFQS